jgi:hypothetical protein
VSRALNRFELFTAAEVIFPFAQGGERSAGMMVFISPRAEMRP